MELCELTSLNSDVGDLVEMLSGYFSHSTADLVLSPRELAGLGQVLQLLGDKTDRLGDLLLQLGK